VIAHGELATVTGDENRRSASHLIVCPLFLSIRFQNCSWF
jgi:hypothetical protein